MPYPGQDSAGGLPAPAADREPGEASDHGGLAGPRGDRAAPPRLTARGAGLVMFAVFFPGALIAGWLHLTAFSGLSFVAGCIIAGLFTRRPDLLVVVTMPPLIFLIALICVKAVTSTGSALISTAEGCILTLSAVAAWLFGGVVIIVVIALFRGLPRAISEFRAALRGSFDFDDPSDAHYRP